MKILVTGCNGYIGAHTVKQLSDYGYDVYGLDLNIYNTHNDVGKYLRRFWHGDINFPGNLGVTFDCIIHLAALINVEESTRIPSRYYQTNTTGTANLLYTNQCDHFIFGSTSAAFDKVSPYGISKAAAEDIVRELHPNYTIFRFYNVAGSNGKYRQVCDPTHLIRVAAMVAAGKQEKLTIFGNDYDTPDGTCLRDYIHVEDLALALTYAVERPANTPYECISTGKTYSNLEVARVMHEVTGKSFPVQFGSRRAGDPAIIQTPGTSDYFIQRKTLEDMCISAYNVEINT